MDGTGTFVICLVSCETIVQHTAVYCCGCFRDHSGTLPDVEALVRGARMLRDDVLMVSNLSGVLRIRCQISKLLIIKQTSGIGILPNWELQGAPASPGTTATFRQQLLECLEGSSSMGYLDEKNQWCCWCQFIHQGGHELRCG